MTVIRPPRNQVVGHEKQTLHGLNLYEDQRIDRALIAGSELIAQICSMPDRTFGHATFSCRRRSIPDKPQLLVPSAARWHVHDLGNVAVVGWPSSLCSFPPPRSQ